MNKSGFVKIDRKITEWEWYKVVNTRALFEHLIYIANYEDKKWQGITIQRGQVVTSIKSLSDETGLTEQEVKTSLKHLKSTSNITIKTTNKYSLVTVENYDLYQTKKRKSTSKITSNETNEQQSTNNNIRNKRNNKEIKNIFPLPNFSEDNLQKLYDN